MDDKTTNIREKLTRLKAFIACEMLGRHDMRLRDTKVFTHMDKITKVSLHECHKCGYIKRVSDDIFFMVKCHKG